jgi:hypothetical protein
MGKTEETKTETQKNEWILCIADFDTASLSESKLAVASVIMRKLAESLDTINFRTRVSPEYAFYEETAWARARSNAAKAIADKQNERSLLVYRGDPEWRYRRNIEKIDAEIEKLIAALEEVEENKPVINKEPIFGLTKDSRELVFPAAPETGNEYRFCLDQKADALLTGSIIDFHERYLVSVRLYTVYTQSFVWEDSIVFSHNDIESAMEEISRRLIVTLSGSESATFIVRTDPEDTLVLINRSFASRGDSSVLEYPPGPITITASAPDHESLTFETELFTGEHAEIGINLLPIRFGNIDITGSSAGSIYHGALYVGESPLTLRMPLNQMEYFELKTPNSERSTIVFPTPDSVDFSSSLFLRASLPPPKGQVDKERRMYYWAWGATWITGIAAWISYQTYINSSSAINYFYNNTGSYDQKFYDNSMRFYYVSMGTVIAAGVAAAFDIFFLSRYLYTADRGSTPIFRSGSN